MSERDGWNDVEVAAEDKIEYEVEQEEPEEVVEEAPVVEAKEVEEVKKEETEEAPELEGIETKGAEKRIRQLIRQRKERDEEVENLLATNKQLTETLKKKEEEVFHVSKPIWKLLKKVTKREYLKHKRCLMMLNQI